MTARFALSVLLLGLAAALMACSGTSETDPPPVERRQLIGSELYLACEGCHTLAAGEPHLVGPNLFGLDGTEAASREGYDYSPALADSGITWNKATLAGWILATEGMAPGTWMLYHNHLEAEEVNRLVTWLLEQN